MGRKRIHFGDVGFKKLPCITCGREHMVDTATVEVECGTCLVKRKSVAVTPAAAPTKVAKTNVEEKTVTTTGKRGRGRPRKNPVETDKKGKSMKTVEKKVEAKGETTNGCKRGRKSTVGSAVLNFIKAQTGDVKFNDILTVYSAEREKLGKKSTPEIESRNAHSTLYVMVRDGKIREVVKKSIYSAC
jgi:hypothetical protein